MKLFLSYGHDDATALVHRIKDDLRTAGHDPWIDSEQLKASPDWRRGLIDGADATDWAIGFLSAHAMRAGGVTRQEFALVDELKGGCLTGVLLEPLANWDPPPGVIRGQWLDFSAWRARKAEGEPGKSCGHCHSAALTHHSHGAYVLV